VKQTSDVTTDNIYPLTVTVFTFCSTSTFKHFSIECMFCLYIVFFILYYMLSFSASEALPSCAVWQNVGQTYQRKKETTTDE